MERRILFVSLLPTLALAFALTGSCGEGPTEVRPVAGVLDSTPAFVVTELSEAFRIGFMLFLAFLIVVLIVASILLALGMSMVSPTIISIPFKILLFVVLDGWARLLQGMVTGYQ